MPPHVVHLANGRLAADTPPDHVRALVAEAMAMPEPHLVLHFHGGLVDHATGLKTAERLRDVYRDAGAYPVFFVWEAGLLETVGNNLAAVARERLFRVVWKRVAAIVRRKFAQSGGQRSAGVLPRVDTTDADRALDEALDRALEADPGAAPDLVLDAPAPEAPPAPLTDFERLSLENELLADPAVFLEVQAVSNGLRSPDEIAADRAARSGGPVRASTATLMDPDVLDELVERPEPGARGLLSTAKFVKAIVTVAARAIRRYADGRDHGFHATVVEEILRAFYLANVGGLIWKTMKQDTWDAFGDDADAHGGTVFLHALRDAVEAGGAPRVTLVGHSTGAVYIAAFIEAADAILPPEVTFEVVWLAPAATFDVAARMLQKSHRVSDLRMFTMDDDHERRDRLVPVLYPHSLLYFVSGVVEPEADTPIVGMHRYYDADRYPAADYPAIETVRAFMRTPHRTIWGAVDAGLGLSTSALRHGDFDNDDATLRSLAHALQHGFAPSTPSPRE